jgi:hypothetical protein
MHSKPPVGGFCKGTLNGVAPVSSVEAGRWTAGANQVSPLGC